MSSDNDFIKIQNNILSNNSSDDNSMNYEKSIERGTNGDPIKITTGYPGLDLFNSLIRGLESDKILKLIDTIVSTGQYQDIVDLF
jgi:hypothetical protein